MVCSAALAIALCPVGALAAETPARHAQSELANAQAQFDLALAGKQNMDARAQQEATNAEMVALLRSEAMRQRQLNMVSNADALERLGAALANAARAQGDSDAQNALAVARVEAAELVAGLDLKLANAQMLFQMRGRADELANARAQADLLHRVADYIAGQQAEMQMSNAREIGQAEADEIHTPTIVEQHNATAMGANELLAADTAVQAGQLDATSIRLTFAAKAKGLLDRAASNLRNAEAQAALH
jgi:hypothetical protein